eukprot:Polyplicarium_translucidae@DN1827_c0_g1_i2.p2
MPDKETVIELDDRRPSKKRSTKDIGQPLKTGKELTPLDEDTRWPIASFWLSFIFPPAGCIMYCMAISSPEGSPRLVWSRRALFLGSGLSVVYVALLCCLLSAYVLPVGVPDAKLGIGF